MHKDIYQPFVERFVEEVKAYRMGNPTDSDVTLGPVVRTDAAEFVRGQVAEAVAAGARALIAPTDFPAGAVFLPPISPRLRKTSYP